jgi:polyhydroxybutyrate depolymerase
MRDLRPRREPNGATALVDSVNTWPVRNGREMLGEPLALERRGSPMKARLPWLLGVLLVVACGSASSGVPDNGGHFISSADDAGTSGTPNVASSGAASSGSADDSGYAEAGNSPIGAGDSAGDGGAATGSDASSCAAGASSTADQPGYMGDWSAGDYPSDFSSGKYLSISGVTGQMGNAREYAVHVPMGYSAAAPVPALFCIHGLDQNPVMFCLDSGVAWPTKADQEGFVVIMPNGYKASWNAGTCCGGAVSAGLDDVALMRAIFAEVGKHVNIDLRRVYATGLSNGGYMSYRLACEASDLFVAVAPSAGAIGTAAIGGGTGKTTDLTTCAPTHKVSVLDIHGTSDPLIPYSTQKPSLAIMQASDTCSMATTAATVEPSGGDTTCVTFEGCPTCPNVEVTGCSIMGGGHCWFGSSDCGTGGGAIGMAFVGKNSNFMKNTDTIWAFFSRISR